MKRYDLAEWIPYHPNNRYMDESDDGDYCLFEEVDAEIAALKERVRELEAERNLLKSDLDKVERGYDEVSQRRDETVAMCDYLQNTVVKRLQAVLEQLADDKGSAYWTSEEVRKIAREALEILAGKEAK